MANPGRKYQHHSVARKREIVEASLRGDESVAVVAREYGVNANQIWAWRKLFSEGRLDNDPVMAGSSASTLLAVDVIEEPPTQPVTASHGGCLEITVGQATGHGRHRPRTATDGARGAIGLMLPTNTRIWIVTSITQALAPVQLCTALVGRKHKYGICNQFQKHGLARRRF